MALLSLFIGVAAILGLDAVWPLPLTWQKAAMVLAMLAFLGVHVVVMRLSGAFQVEAEA